MAERTEGESAPQEQAIHHDELNEFGEETWTALGENAESVNNILGRGTFNGNLHDRDASLQIAVGPMDPTTAHVSSNLPLINQDSVETFENEEFLAEEVDTLKSCSTIDVKTPNEVEKEGQETAELVCLSLTTTVQQPSVSSKTSSVRRSGYGEFCRICHEANFNENYISPCDCRGSLSLVHRSCLERWLAQSDTNHCELCGYTFTMVRMPKYGLLSSLIAWTSATSSMRERKKLVMDLVILIIVCPIVGLCNFLAIRLADTIFSPQKSVPVEPTLPDDALKRPESISSVLNKVGQVSIFSMLATMNLTFLLWFLMRCQHHTRKWYTWYRRNCLVKLIGYQEVNISIKGEPSTSSTNNIRSISF